MSQLFSPIKIGEQTLDNRIIIPPMCQYSALNGIATDWHKMHYGSLSHSGAGLLIIEATAVNPVGRISPFDLGLWSDETQNGLSDLIKTIRHYSDMPVAIQLGHAGRKGSMSLPWEKDEYITPDRGGWQTVAPSSIKFADHYGDPHALTLIEVKAIIQDFADAAMRADRAGIDMIEIHGAHGYLLHQFLSPLSNHRTDQYGGVLENRMRLILEVFKSIRAAFPTHKAVGVRISATDWVKGGWDIKEALTLCDALKKLGCSFIHVSTAGLSSDQKIPVGPNYQVPFAKRIKEVVGMPTIAVGLITEAAQAENIIALGEADMVAIGRGMLYNPHWAWSAAQALNGQVIAPPQYLRAAPHEYKKLFKEI